MSTICTCGKADSLFCNYANGCKFTTDKGALKEPESLKAVSLKTEAIKAEYMSEAGKPVKYLSGPENNPGGGVRIELPNGDEFKIRYDSDAGAIVINKMSDRDGIITIRGGSGQNQIFIK